MKTRTNFLIKLFVLAFIVGIFAGEIFSQICVHIPIIFNDENNYFCITYSCGF